MKYEKMRLSREISGGEKTTQHTERKTAWSIKQMRCVGRDHSLDWVCDQLQFVFLVKDIGKRGKGGNEAAVCTAPRCQSRDGELSLASGAGDFGSSLCRSRAGTGHPCH